jgi:phage N-6-adenine-methyltransferase
MSAPAEILVKSLTELESVIERGLRTYQEVGQALDEIRERRLYREQGHATFEEYCRERWGWNSRQVSYNYIAASRVAENVQTTGQNTPSLSQAVELAALEPEQQREVAQAVEADGKSFDEIPVRDVRDIVREVKAGTSPNLAVLFSSASSEWYTPPEIIDRVVKVLGGIDLDPCSNSAESPKVPAAAHYTKEHDGLSRMWRGRVYLNPPYGRTIGAWVEKLCAEQASGRVTAAIALVPARVDTGWFRRFRDFAVCFIDGRLKFSGHENSAPFPSAVVYLGDDVSAFHAGFADLGDVWVRWRDRQRGPDVWEAL